MITDVLIGGLLASTAFTAVIFASYFWCPEVWIQELTEGREDGGASPWKSGLIVAGTVVAMLGGAGLTAWWVASGGVTSYWVLAAIAWGVLVVINLWDLVVIDIVLYMWVSPSFMQWEGYPRLDRYWPHVRGSLMGAFPIGIPMALIAALPAYWLS